MEKLTELSSSVEIAKNEFSNSWSELQKKVFSQKKLVKARTMLRATGSAQDILGLLPVLLEVHENCHSTSSEQYERLIVGMPPDGKPSFVRSIFEEREYFEKPQRQFAACLKAMFFYLRSFQDILLSILFELKGETSSRRTSMARLLKPSNNNALRTELETSLPAYSPWFQKFSELRNKMKYGLDVSHGFRVGPNGLLVFVQTRTVNETDKGRALIIGQELSLQDVLNALKMSTDLVNFVCKFKQITNQSRRREGARGY